MSHRRTTIPSPNESPTNEGDRLPVAFKGPDKYATLFGPPSGEHHPAWASTQKQDEFALMHERYAKQQKTTKAVSRDAAWADKRRRFLEKRGGGRSTALEPQAPVSLAAAAPGQVARELSAPDRGSATRQGRATFNERSAEQAKYQMKGYANSCEGAESETHVSGQDASEAIIEPYRADGSDAKRIAGEASILGVGDYEERKEKVRQQEKEDLRQYLKEREKTPKVTARGPSSPGGSVLPGIGSARNNEAERRRKEIQDEMRQFLSRKPPGLQAALCSEVKQGNSFVTSSPQYAGFRRPYGECNDAQSQLQEQTRSAADGCTLRGLGEDGRKRREDIQRQEKENLLRFLRRESPTRCRSLNTFSPPEFPMSVSQRVSRARSRSQSPSPALNVVDPREEELRQRKKRQQLEQKKWLDEQASWGTR